MPMRKKPLTLVESASTHFLADTRASDQFSRFRCTWAALPAAVAVSANAFSLRAASSNCAACASVLPTALYLPRARSNRPFLKNSLPRALAASASATFSSSVCSQASLTLTMFVSSNVTLYQPEAALGACSVDASFADGSSKVKGKAEADTSKTVRSLDFISFTTLSSTDGTWASPTTHISASSDCTLEPDSLVEPSVRV
mmetsp:Transcript_7773/g.24936  ORF Transcript_7773/g.24936 Transcript_7773/m.24936 type:complete len:200 (+) Transcript_7773:251-850(+)